MAVVCSRSWNKKLGGRYVAIADAATAVARYVHPSTDPLLLVSERHANITPSQNDCRLASGVCIRGCGLSTSKTSTEVRPASAANLRNAAASDSAKGPGAPDGGAGISAARQRAFRN